MSNHRSSRTPTAHWKVRSLLQSLSRAGWGDLAGREWQGVRSTLSGLADQVHRESGQGWTTAYQVAQSAGLSERWVRHCLGLLEDGGFITWSRGGVIDGAPQPSYFRIVKTRLVDLIRAARPMKDAADRARRVATGKRIGHMRFIRSEERRRRSDHTELSTSPRPLRGDSTGNESPVKDEKHSRRAPRGVSEAPQAARASGLSVDLDLAAVSTAPTAAALAMRAALRGARRRS